MGRIEAIGSPFEGHKFVNKFGNSKVALKNLWKLVPALRD